MNKFFAIVIILLIPITAKTKLTILSPDNSSSFTDQVDKDGNKTGSIRKDNYGTTHTYDKDGNKIGTKRDDGFEQTAEYELKSDKKDP